MRKISVSVLLYLVTCSLLIPQNPTAGRVLYVSHSGEYFIEALDLEKGQIIRRFSRDYPRIKHMKKDWEDDLHKKYNVPIMRFEPDVEGLFINKDLIWVKTSTKDEEKGFLMDVFDSEGEYLDNFCFGA